jgi:6,7-dimethyl-8-ribityllumazine synthase
MMVWIHEGQLNGEGLKPAIVVSRFNSFITGRLLDGALDCLERHGVLSEDIDVFWVPGAWEIASMALKLASTDAFDLILCLGAVIRGETPHFEYVSSESAKGVSLAALEAEIPVIYGIVTADTIDQAIDRAGSKAGNKGFDAAMTGLEMVSLYDTVYGFGDDDDEEITDEDEQDA